MLFTSAVALFVSREGQSRARDLKAIVTICTKVLFKTKIGYFWNSWTMVLDRGSGIFLCRFINKLQVIKPPIKVRRY